MSEEANEILPTEGRLLEMEVHQIMPEHPQPMPPVEIHLESEIASYDLPSSISNIPLRLKFLQTRIHNRYPSTPVI